MGYRRRFQALVAQLLRCWEIVGMELGGSEAKHPGSPSWDPGKGVGKRTETPSPCRKLLRA